MFPERLLEGQCWKQEWFTSIACETCILCCLIHVCPKTKKELSIGVCYVLVIGLAVPVAGKHFLVIDWVIGYILPKGLSPMTKVSLLPNRKGSRRWSCIICLKGQTCTVTDSLHWWWYSGMPSVPFSSITCMGTEAGMLCFCCICLIRVSWWGKVTPFWNVCLVSFSMKPTILLKRYSGNPAFESMR